VKADRDLMSPQLPQTIPPPAPLETLSRDAAVQALCRLESALLDLSHGNAPAARFRVPSAPAELDDVVLVDLEDLEREPTRPGLRVGGLAALIAVVALLAGCATATADAAASLGSVLDTAPSADAGAPDAPPPPPDAPPPPVDAPPPSDWSQVLYDPAAPAGPNPVAQGWSWYLGSDAAAVFPTGVVLEAYTGSSRSAGMRRTPVPRNSAIFTVAFTWVAGTPDAVFEVSGLVPGATVVVRGDGWGWYDGTGWTPVDPSTLTGPLLLATDGAGNASATIDGKTITRADVGLVGAAQGNIGVHSPSGWRVSVVVTSVTEREPVGGVHL